MQGFILEKGFHKAVLLVTRVISRVDPTQRIQVLMLPNSPSTVAHGTTAGHLPKPTHTIKTNHIPNTSYVPKP